MSGAIEKGKGYNVASRLYGLIVPGRSREGPPTESKGKGHIKTDIADCWGRGTNRARKE